MELRKQQQLYNGFAGKAHLQRREQIIKRLGQLATMELEHYDELYEEWQMKMKAYMTTPTLTSELSSSVLFLSIIQIKIIIS